MFIYLLFSIYILHIVIVVLSVNMRVYKLNFGIPIYFATQMQ